MAVKFHHLFLYRAQWTADDSCELSWPWVEIRTCSTPWAGMGHTEPEMLSSGRNNECEPYVDIIWLARSNFPRGPHNEVEVVEA